MSFWLMIPMMVISWAVVSLGFAALIGRGLGAATSRWPGADAETEVVTAKWTTGVPAAGTSRLSV